MNNSDSEDLINVQSISYLWTIQNFIKYLKKEKPHEIRSPILKTRINNKDSMYPKWYLDIQFNNKNTKDFISIHLNLLPISGTKKVNVTMKFSIVNASGNLVNLFEYDYEFSKNDGFGVDEYIKKDNLIKNQENLLPNNNFRILCEIIIHNNVLINIPNPLDLSEDFEEIFDKKLHSDVNIVGKNKVFPVHRVILSARSSVFSEMFKKNTKDTKIEIKDFNDDVLEEVLRFIYCGKLEGIHKIVDDLIQAAEKFKLDELKKICIQTLGATLSVQNVIKRLLIAESSGIADLKKSAVKFIFSNRKQVIVTEDYKLLESSHPHLLAEAFSILLKD